MKITVEFTPEEKELVMLFIKHGDLSTFDNFCGWGNTKEFKVLKSGNIIHHSNSHNHGSYIVYTLTSFGRLAAEQNNLHL